jgi:serine protease Do
MLLKKGFIKTMDIKQELKINRYLNVAVLVAAIFAGSQWYKANQQAAMAPNLPAKVQPNFSAKNPTASANTAMVTLPNFATIAENQGQAVVNISVTGMVKTASPLDGLSNMDPDDPFYQFFKRFAPHVAPQERPVSGMGSGFIVNSDGVVLTNAHVVENANEVTVKLVDKREFKAKVIGVDKATDVAVLKIDANDLPSVKIGNPLSTKVGDWVVAIGAPFGFENTVTAGIVSAKSRALPDDNYVPFLQTDVAINPGNSGGPLFNLNGEVVGINSQIYSQSGGYQGLSFAIPIDVAMNIEQQLVTNGKVSRGRIGVGVQSINQELANSFGLQKAQGALVSSLDDKGPAANAGVRIGDVITKFNGQIIAQSSDLPALVAAIKPGQTATLEVWRNNQSKTLTVKVGESAMTVAAAPEEAVTNKAKLGLALRQLTVEEKAQTQLKHGLIVENVEDGPAAKAGIRPGDIVLAVNGESINSVQDLAEKLDGKRKTIALLVMRENNKMFVPIALAN